LNGFVYTTGSADILIEVTIENFRKISEEVRTQESPAYEGCKTMTKKVPTLNSKQVVIKVGELQGKILCFVYQ